MYPSLPLTTGTFNLVVKEPIRYRLSGRFQFRADLHSRERVAITQICLSSKLVQATRLAQPLSTHCWYRISTCFPQPGSAPRLRGLSSSLSFRTASSVRNLPLALYKHATEHISHTAPMPFRHKPRRKTIKFDKRSLGGFCKQRIQPFEEPCPRMKPRGRD